MLNASSAASHCSEECPATEVVASVAQLNKFLGDPLWWPQDKALLKSNEESSSVSESHTASPRMEKAQRRLQLLRLLLSTASFEALEVKLGNNKFELDSQGVREHAHGRSAGNHKACRVWEQRVPACFALFTRFNCNVTLVAQKLLASKIDVSVLTSGSVAVEGEDMLRFLKYARSGDSIYRRHVMLCAHNKKSKYASSTEEPFSYGFLLTFLHALPPRACELVLSESLPFGSILDQCKVSRSVEVDSQLHIHIGEGFFSLKRECQKDEKDQSMPVGGEDCRCIVLPKGMRCTFGRLTTIRCNGRPAARVLEILNDKLVLTSLFEAEEEHDRQQNEQDSRGCHSLGGRMMSALQRRGLLANRCLLSVARCPAHSGALPRPYVTAEALRSPRDADAGCRLCASKTCSTDFEAEYTADLLRADSRHPPPSALYHTGCFETSQ